MESLKAMLSSYNHHYTYESDMLVRNSSCDLYSYEFHVVSHGDSWIVEFSKRIKEYSTT